MPCVMGCKLAIGKLRGGEMPAAVCSCTCARELSKERFGPMVVKSIPIFCCLSLTVGKDWAKGSHKLYFTSLRALENVRFCTIRCCRFRTIVSGKKQRQANTPPTHTHTHPSLRIQSKGKNSLPVHRCRPIQLQTHLQPCTNKPH